MKKPSIRSSLVDDVNLRERLIFIVLSILLIVITLAMIASFVYLK